jgi:lycopene cyclase domain-containing protein
MPGLYLAALLFSILGLALLDRKHRLVFWANAKMAALTTAICVVFFSVWDAVGIFNGIFFKGDNELLVGFEVFYEYPLEEAFFLTLLAYTGQMIMAASARMKKRVVK